MYQRLFIATILAFTLLEAQAAQKEKIIINKVYISPGSVVTGNTGIIIGNKKIEGKNLAETDLTKPVQTDFSCTVHDFDFQAQDLTLHFKPSAKCRIRYPRFLTLQKEPNRLWLSDSNKTGIPSEIIIWTRHLEKVRIDGDAEVFIDANLTSLTLDIDGDATLHFNNINRLDLHFRGDVSIEANSIASLKAKGKGDVTIMVKKGPVKIQKDIEGELLVSEGVEP